LSAYVFVPVTSAETLAESLASYISSKTDVGDGVYKVVGSEAGKEVFVKETNGWLFASDSKETLANVPSNPTELFGGMEKKYDVGLRLQVKNAPSGKADECLATLDKTFGSVLRGLTSKENVESIGKLLTSLDEVTMGWSSK
jgi:hypothetical protein